MVLMVDVKKEHEFVNPNASHSKGDRTSEFERLVQYFVFVEQSNKFSSVQWRLVTPTHVVTHE
jgi:hypothetical protein